MTPSRPRMSWNCLPNCGGLRPKGYGDRSKRLKPTQDFSPHTRRHRCSCRSVVPLHPNSGVGRRRADLVRRGAAYPSVGHRSARDGRDVQSGASLPCGRPDRGARSSGDPAGHAQRRSAHRPYIGARSDDALPLGRRRWRQSNRGLLHVAPFGRPILRDGPRWLCREMGQILARASLQLTSMQASDGCHNDGKNGGRHCHRAPARCAQPADRPQRLSGGRTYSANFTVARAAGRHLFAAVILGMHYT